MEIYLNIAEWGPDGQFGIEAGAQAAFGTDADALSWERASLLAVTLPNPWFVDRPGRQAVCGALPPLWSSAPSSMESGPIAWARTADWRFNKH